MKNYLQTFLSFSIKQKLIFMVMVTTTLALLLISVVFVVYYIIESKQRMVQEMTVLAKVIGNRSTAAILYDDSRLAQENLSALTEKKSIVLSCIYKTDGSVFAYYSVRKVENPCPEIVADGYNFSSNELRVYQGIVLENERIGTIMIEADLVEIRNNLLRYALYVVILGLLTILVSYIVSAKLQALISSPIFHLVDTAKAISGSGNYSFRAIKTSSDELGILVDAFNRMVSQVQERDKQLLGSKADLEKRVAERTHDLEIARDTAEQANAAKSLFLANMSHELRTPMHAILSFANFGIEALNTKIDQEELLHYYSRIKDSGSRLLLLVNNLLDLSKLESCKMDFVFKRGDIEKSISAMVQELQPLIKQKKLEFKFIKPKDAVLANYDPTRLGQVLNNLLSNSIKFTPEGKTVTLEITRQMANPEGNGDVECAVVSIRDEGIGIPENELDKIFDKFFQSSKTKTGAGGTGLGLAICMEIIKGHRGKIWAENEANGGAKFTFMIPIEVEIPKKDIV